MAGSLEGPEEYISLARAGELSGCNPDTLRVQAVRGRLRTVKIGRAHLTNRRWLHEYLVATGQRDKVPLPADYVAPE